MQPIGQNLLAGLVGVDDLTSAAAVRALDLAVLVEIFLLDHTMQIA